MTTVQWECKDVVTAISSPVRNLCNGLRVILTASTTQAVGNLPIAHYFRDTALQEVSTLLPRAVDKDKFDTIAYRLMPEERPESKTRPTDFASSVKLGSTARRQLASLPGLMNDTFLWPFEYAGRATE